MVAFLLHQVEDSICLGKRANPRFGIGYLGIREEDGGLWIRTYTYGHWRELPGQPRPGRQFVGEMNWRYGGSGPAQLAWNILLHALQNADLAGRFYQAFKRKIVARLHHRRWHLSQGFVLRWVRNQVNEHGELCQMRADGVVVIV